MASTTKIGNYYKRKTKEWFSKRGYNVEYLEINYPIFIKGRTIFTKKDILCSDGVAYNAEEFILWNSKHAASPKYISDRLSKGKKKYQTLIVPPFIKKQVIIWQKRKPPIIENV